MARIAFNKNASINLDATKLRIKMVDGTMYIRPTERKLGASLPKGEILIELKLRSETSKTVTVPFRLTESMFVLHAAKHGWYEMVPTPVLEVKATDMAGRVG